MNTHRVSLSCSRVFFQFILAATAVFVAACAGSYGGGTTQPVSVQISPTSASVQTGNTQQFAATVSYATNTAVTWQVNAITGGDAAHGMISATGLYTAPSAVPNPVSVTVSSFDYRDCGFAG